MLPQILALLGAGLVVAWWGRPPGTDTTIELNN
jgi:hypothetical protein